MTQNSELTEVFGSSGTGSVSARYRRQDGRFVDMTLQQLDIGDVIAGLPVREFRSYKGRRHYSGWYWSATTGSHVVYESRLELARLIVADQDSSVVGIAAQPFLRVLGGGREMDPDELGRTAECFADRNLLRDPPGDPVAETAHPGGASSAVGAACFIAAAADRIRRCGAPPIG